MTKKPHPGRAAMLAAMPGTIAQLAERTGLHPQTAWRNVEHLLLRDECHVSGKADAGKRGRAPYIYAQGKAGDEAIERTEPKRVLRVIPDDVPKRDALTVGLFGRA